MGRPGELAQARIVHLQPLHVVTQVVGVLPDTVEVAVPEQPLGPLKLARQARTLVSIVVGNAAGMLLQHRQAHGDVEPVQDVLGLRSNPLGQQAHFLPAIGQKRDILVGLQSLLLQQGE